jgi:hypothetical protein
VSAFLYGRMVQRRRTQPQVTTEGVQAPAEEENKLATTIAALFPAEILTAHAFIVSKATTTDADGNTTITNGALLHDSLLWFLVASVVLYVIGRGFASWSPTDFVRLLVPPLAFLVWAAVIGTTTALTPWISELTAPGGALPKDWFVLAGVVSALILIAVSSRVNPPQPA